MQRVIKDDERTIAKQMRGKEVEATQDLKYPDKWHFEFCGEKWVASEQAFKNGDIR